MIPQIKTLPASQVKNSFGTIVSQVHNGKYKEVIVENHGEPIVAIVDVKELKAMRDFRDKERQSKALAQLRKVREEVQARLKGSLSEKEVTKMGNRFSREFVQDLEKEGKVRFEPKSS